MFHTCIKLVAISVICRIQLVLTETSISEEDLHYGSYEDIDVCPKFDHNKTCCNSDEFQCKSGTCVPLEKVCESVLTYQPRIRFHMYVKEKADCESGTDEIGCSNEPCTSRRSKCHQSCLDLPGNRSICTCYKGYTLSVTNTCVDIDECQIGVHSCSQKCVNLNGTFSCSCNEGFQKDYNGLDGACKAEDRNILILYNSYNWVYSYNVETSQRQVLVRAGKIQNMDYDIFTDIVYWSNLGIMSRSYIPGAKDGNVTEGHPQRLEGSTDHDNITSFSIDWSAGNLYWLKSSTLNKSVSHIIVSKLDRRYSATVFTVIEGNSLVVDTENGKIYWACKGNRPYIGSAWMNGKNRATLIQLPHQNPIALAVDQLSNGRLYWVDSSKNTIYFAYKDGKRPTAVVTTSKEQAPIALDIFENDIYWLTKHSNELMSCDIFGRREPIVLVQGLVGQTSLKVYHKRKMDTKGLRYSLGDTCTLACDFLCLHTPYGFTCDCPDGANFVRVSSENTCSAQHEEPADNPLVCNCNDKEKICNIALPYRQCTCHAHCLDGLHDPNEDDDGTEGLTDNNNKTLIENLYKIYVLLVLFIILILCVLSFYKRSS